MEIKEKLRQPKTIFWTLASFSALLNLGSFLWMYFKVPADAYPFIAHYNIYFGQDILGSKLMLFQIPLAGLVILILNTVLAWILFEKARFFSWVLGVATLLMQLFILYGSAIIIFVNS